MTDIVDIPNPAQTPFPNHTKSQTPLKPIQYKLNKDQKVKFIDFLESLCNDSRLSRKSIGNSLRAFHVSTPIIMAVLLLYGPQWIATLMIINCIIVLSLFYMFGGCFLSMLEKRLCGDEYTIADPVLELLGCEMTNKNRYYASYMIAGSYMFVFFIIYFFRFYSGRFIKMPIISVSF
jgi:hypothetical protein